MNKQLADFANTNHFQSFTQARVQKHAPPDVCNPFNDHVDITNRSVNSEAFSHYSMPSNNFVNGMRVNVPSYMQRPLQ